jgi:hypothetical protein
MRSMPTAPDEIVTIEYPDCRVYGDKRGSPGVSGFCMRTGEG